MAGLVATASTTIDAGRDRVWRAVTDPAELKQYFFGSDVESDWTPGSAITWSGEYDGKDYTDKGEIVAVDEPNRLEMTHYSPLTGKPDVPESYHTLVYTLDGDNRTTTVTMTQDNNADQAEVDQNAASWGQILEAMKKHVEGS